MDSKLKICKMRDYKEMQPFLKAFKDCPSSENWQRLLDAYNELMEKRDRANG